MAKHNIQIKLNISYTLRTFSVQNYFEFSVKFFLSNMKYEQKSRFNY
jgi:hypothetical protein